MDSPPPSNPIASPPSSQSFRALVRVFGQLRRVMEPYFARHGISGAQWGILRALHTSVGEKSEPVRLVDLSSKLLVRPPSITSAIGRLTKMGLVALKPSEKDQRVKLVNLTAAGRKLVGGILEDHGRHIGRIMGVLSEVEQEQLGELLDRVSKNLESMSENEL